MATALQRQLQGLQNKAPATKSDKRRPSLLFDSREAATHDREAVLEIGVSGLDELVKLEPRFENYRTVLFSRSSGDYNRLIQTKEENARIDHIIQKFLIAVSPYFEKLAAQKCLEWLIYRFYINEMNVDDFILCILPYHDYEMFPRALMLIDFDNDKTKQWHFLKECAKSNSPLARQVLFNRARKDPDFLSGICQYLISQLEDLGHGDVKRQVDFWMILMLRVLDYPIDINERLLSVLIPNISQGLRSHCTQHKAATYMILALLMSKIRLLPERSMMLLADLVKHIQQPLVREAVYCLGIIVRHQKIRKLPEEICSSIEQYLQNFSSEELKSSILKQLVSLISPPPMDVEASNHTDQSVPALGDLDHVKSGRRIQAINQLMSEIEEGNTDLSQSFIEDALLNRLQDDNHKVVRAVLGLNKKLVELVEKKKIAAVLLELVEKKYNHSKWKSEVNQAIRLFCSEEALFSGSGSITTILGWLLATEKDISDKETVCARVLDSAIIRSNQILNLLPVADLLKMLDQAVKEPGENAQQIRLSQYNSKLIKSLAIIISKLDEKDFRHIMAELTELKVSISGRGRFLLICSLSAAIKLGKENTQNLVVASELLKLLKLCMDQPSQNDEGSVGGNTEFLEKDLESLELVPWLTYLRKTNRVPMELIQWSISQMLSVLCPATKLSDEARITGTSPSVISVLEKIFEIIVSPSVSDSVWSHLRSKFEKETEILSLHKLLVVIISELLEHEGADTKWISRSVYSAAFDILRSVCSETMPFEAYMSLSVLPRLLLALQSSCQEVRISVVHCLQKISKTYRLLEGTTEKDQLKKLLKKNKIQLVDRTYAKELRCGFFRALPSVEVQCAFVSQMLDLALMPHSSSHMTKIVLSCMEQMKLDGIHVSHELTRLTSESSLAVIKNSGKKKTKVTKRLEKDDFKRPVLILEVLDSRKTFGDTNEVAQILFDMLSRLRLEEGEAAERCMQLTLHCLCKICEQWQLNKDCLNKEYLNIEMVRMCISDSRNPRNQQEAMKLLAAIAPLYPEYVLTNAVSIFTFMGTDLIQIDTEYTFNIILKTIDAVITAVTKAAPRHQTNGDIMVDLMRILVDARVAEHRKLPLFRCLIERVGVEVHLWSLIILIMERSCREQENLLSLGQKHDPSAHSSLPSDKSNIVDVDMKFGADLCGQFPADVQLRCIGRMVLFLQKLITNYVQATHDAKGLGSVVKEQLSILGASILSPGCMRLLLFHLTRTVIEVLDSSRLIAEVIKRADGHKVDEGLEVILQELILNCLALQTAATQSQLGSKATDLDQKISVKLLKKILQILSKVLYLLPTASFLEVVQSLLDNELVSIQVGVLNMFSNRITPMALADGKIESSNDTTPPMDLTKLHDDEFSSLEKLIVKLVKMAEQPTPEQRVGCRQMALFCSNLLCRQLGKEKPKLFVAAIPVTVMILAEKNVPQMVLCNALMCITEICRKLGSKFVLKYLHNLLPPILNMLANVEFLLSNELVFKCLLKSTNELIACFLEMLDHYIVKILNLVCILPKGLMQNQFKKPTEVHDLLISIAHRLASTLESRVFLPKAQETYNELLRSHQPGLSEFFGFIKLHICANKSDLKDESKAISRDLLEIFDNGMNLRSTADQLSWEEMLLVENAMVESICEMVLYLTEKQFLSMYNKLFSYIATEKSLEYKLRQLSFFHLSYSLADKLGSFFSQFASHILNAACEFLEVHDGSKKVVSWFNEDKEAKKTCLMLDYVIGCLHKCLASDEKNTFGKSVVSKIMTPITNQLENLIGGEQQYKRRIVEFVVPCIGQMAIAAKATGNWKDLNYQVCLKTRNTKSKVKLSALLAIEEMTRKLGNDYDTLLPETLQFIAELLEDDSPEVVEECHRVKCTMEEVVGESLSKYLE